MTMCCFMHPSPAVTGKRSGCWTPVLRKNSTRARIRTEVLTMISQDLEWRHDDLFNVNPLAWGINDVSHKRLGRAVAAHAVLLLEKIDHIAWFVLACYSLDT